MIDLPKSKISDMHNLVAQAHKIVVIQAENPDGDSLGSSLALEGLLTNLGKKVYLYCPVNLPGYIRYFEGWDRVTNEFDYKADLAIIVDTASKVLLSKLLKDPIINNFLHTKPVIVIDHHSDVKPDLDFKSLDIIMPTTSTAELLYYIAKDIDWQIDKSIATNLLASISSDTLGMTTANVTYELYLIAADLMKAGANITSIEDARRELSKKSQEILAFKGELISRIKYELDGKLALVEISFDDIREYSDKYNPSMLVLDEMRLVEGVVIALAIKTYPDGKLTGKIRTNKPIANQIAGYFGGGGHEYAAGFRAYESYDKIFPEIIDACRKALSDETL